MFTRFLIVIAILTMVVSACVPAEGTDVFEVGIEPATEISSSQVVKDELQPIMEAVYSDTLEGTLALMQFVEISCANVEGLGGPPPCPEGVAEGTLLEVFPTLSSHGALVSREEFTNMLLNLQVKNLYAVYLEEPNPNAEPNYQPGEYAMLFERELNDMPIPVVLQVKDGRIVRIDYHIGISPEEMLKGISVEKVLVSPQEAKAWTESVQ
ncbi:MAG TPA: hypothetical protein DCX53_14705 [Anaerolineae bacterium]|nr:hypothetical protein [Anaerolineae bacterium]